MVAGKCFKGVLFLLVVAVAFVSSIHAVSACNDVVCREGDYDYDLVCYTDGDGDGYANDFDGDDRITLEGDASCFSDDGSHGVCGACEGEGDDLVAETALVAEIDTGYAYDLDDSDPYVWNPDSPDSCNGHDSDGDGVVDGDASDDCGCCEGTVDCSEFTVSQCESYYECSVGESTDCEEYSCTFVTDEGHCGSDQTAFSIYGCDDSQIDSNCDNYDSDACTDSTDVVCVDCVSESTVEYCESGDSRDCVFYTSESSCEGYDGCSWACDSDGSGGDVDCYVDNDDDGFGLYAELYRVDQVEVYDRFGNCPDGYVDNNDDCNDDDEDVGSCSGCLACSDPDSGMSGSCVGDDSLCGTTSCSAPHTVGSCGDSCTAYGVCEDCVPDCSCEDGYAACDGSLSDGDGCEVDLSSDDDNCGSCGNVCGSHAFCSGGSCVCEAGWVDANGDMSDGCEEEVSYYNDELFDCDDSDPDVNPGEEEVCNYQVDDDCDGLVDEGTSDGRCTVDGVSACEGSVDCSSYGAIDCPEGVGCSVDRGRCSVSGGLCVVDGDCPDDDDLCEGASCGGSPACNQFLTESYCDGSDGRPGCSWNSTVAGYDDMGNCEGAGGVWVCGDSTEICNNGVDDDGDGLVDCMDPDCQVARCDDGSCSSVSPRGVSMANVSRFNCLEEGVYSESTDLGGFSVDYDGDGSDVEYYCGSPESHEDVGVCCPETYKPVYRSFDDEWSCEDTQPCLAPEGFCDYKYSDANFTDWMNDPGCLDSSAPSACCSVVQFGDEDYYSDSDNVKVY